MDLIFTGRIVLSGPRDIEGHDQLEKYIMGASLITMKGQPVTKTKGWEMMECEVIIRPKKIHRKCRYDNARLDNVVLALGDDTVWSETEIPEKSVWDELME